MTAFATACLRSFRTAALLVALLPLARPDAGTAHAQSLFATRGLGVPIAPLDGRSAALGGAGIGLFGYQASLVNPAAAAGTLRRGVTAVLQPVTGTARIDGETDDLNGSRFPLLAIIFPMNDRLALSLGYGGFLEQSWHVTTVQEEVVGGLTRQLSENIRSAGGISQLRFNAGYAITPRIAIGLGAGMLTGNVTRDVFRGFINDPAGDYTVFSGTQRWSYDNVMLSVGARWDVDPAIRLAASYAHGTDLDATAEPRGDPVGEAESRVYSGPSELAFGGSIQLTSDLLVTAGAARLAVPGLTIEDEPATQSRDTWRVGGGIEFAGLRRGVRVYPLRLGLRRVQLPYWHDGETAPQESSVAAGLGFRLGDPANPAALADLSLERAVASGLETTSRTDGLEERVWRFTFSLSLFGN